MPEPGPESHSEGHPADDFRREFRGVTGQFASGVSVVLTMLDGQPHAATVSSFVLVSFDPPLVAVFFGASSRMHDMIEKSGRFSISMLDAADHGLARRFARPGRIPGWEGLAGVELVHRDPGLPVLSHAIAWLDCSVADVAPMGDHGCFVGHVDAVGRRPEAEPLVYYRGRFYRLGRSVAPAPWSTLDPDDLAADW